MIPFTTGVVVIAVVAEVVVNAVVGDAFLSVNKSRSDLTEVMRD